MKALYLILVLLTSLLCMTLVYADSHAPTSQTERNLTGLDSQITETKQQQETKFHLRRRLPGGFDFAHPRLTPEDVSALFFILILLCLFSCLCGRGRGRGRSCSLWDILACVCIWELCCDDRAINDFAMMPP